MTGYFSTVELNSALSSLSSKLTEKANTAHLYPVLKKATSGSEEPTPGYVYQVRIYLIIPSKFYPFLGRD